MKIKTPSDLKFWHEHKNPDSHFFTRKTMKSFGDTMRNYGVRQPRPVKMACGNEVMCYELFRRRPTFRGCGKSAWFDAETLARRYPPNS